MFVTTWFPLVGTMHDLQSSVATDPFKGPGQGPHGSGFLCADGHG